jgi:hypothetical protein
VRVQLAKWLSCLARFVTANSSLWKDALRVLECIVHRSELSLSQIFTTNFRPLPYRALRSEVPSPLTARRTTHDTTHTAHD